MRERNKTIKLREPSHFRGISLNITPLVDIVFQLIVFFLVVSQVVTAEREPMDIPAPRHSQAKEKKFPSRLIINLFSDADGKITKIKVNAQVIKDMSQLADLLLRDGRLIDRKGGAIILRADKHLRFREVKGVIQLISNAGITHLHIAAQQERG